MTRYSASRGIAYSAPPGPEDERTADLEATAAEPAETDAGAAAETDGDADPAAADD